MSTKNPLRPLVARAFAAMFLFALLAACESDRSRGPGRSAERSGPPRAPTPEMETHGMFLADQIETEVLLGKSGFEPRVAASSDAGGGNAGARGGGMRGGFGGGRRGGGGGGGRRGGGGGMGGGGDEDRPAARPGEDGTPAPQIRASHEPPVQLKLRLTNHGTEPVDVEVSDFNSELGNFVVQPRKITIPPGESVEAEPMTSRLGVSEEEIPLTVTIRAAGKSDKQVLMLHPKVVPATPATENTVTAPNP